ncbi:hypothetical protein NKJ70_31930 [Mesorhizobium sp. M0092]|uniref:hypothetical protein n=1 Tax=Mesorhizobium sp. M0092 TaxID=2956876 RepID=UPI0033390E3F
MALGKTLNSKVVTLSGHLPQIWADDATTDAHRKALLRCLVEKVVLDRGEHDVALARIVWRGGAVTELEVKMKVNSVAKLTRGEEMRVRLLDLAITGMPPDRPSAAYLFQNSPSVINAVRDLRNHEECLQLCAVSRTTSSVMPGQQNLPPPAAWRTSIRPCRGSRRA